MFTSFDFLISLTVQITKHNLAMDCQQQCWLGTETLD